MFLLRVHHYIKITPTAMLAVCLCSVCESSKNDMFTVLFEESNSFSTSSDFHGLIDSSSGFSKHIPQMWRDLKSRENKKMTFSKI